MFTGNPRSAPDFAVARTRIFARPDGLDQWLVYAMQVAAPSELAMILPLPVPISSADDAATFLDLSAYPELFSDLDRCFGEFPLAACASSSPPPQSAARPRLEVHAMGAFEASYVPHQRDFSRLDPRFRLPDEIWRMLPSYRAWGFAVIQLKPGPQDVHPIVLRFPRRWPDRLYFPTVHVHDATLHREADQRGRLAHPRIQARLTPRQKCPEQHVPTTTSRPEGRCGAGSRPRRPHRPLARLYRAGCATGVLNESRGAVKNEVL